MSVNIYTAAGLKKVAGSGFMDAELNANSNNGVKNKVLKEKFDQIEKMDLTDTSLEGQDISVSQFLTMVARKLYPKVLNVLEKPVSWFTDTAGSVYAPLRIVTSASGPQGLMYGHAVTPVLSGYNKIVCSWSGTSATRVIVCSENGSEIAIIAPPSKQSGSYSGEIDISEYSNGNYKFKFFTYNYGDGSSTYTQFSTLRFE